MTKNKKAALNTCKGRIVIELDFENAPITAKNFADYVGEGFYNGTIFHRVINGFMIQGGGLCADMKEKAGNAPIKLESQNGLQNLRGTVAMARTAAPDSATSQFFINHSDNDFLNYSPANPGYAVFAKVVEGMDVVDEIADAETTSKGYHDDVPVETILIETVEFVD